MPEWIFTFGFHHVHPETGERLRNRFVRIQAPDSETARGQMVARFGLKWSHQYSTEGQAGVQEYGLTELSDAQS